MDGVMKKIQFAIKERCLKNENKQTKMNLKQL